MLTEQEEGKVRDIIGAFDNGKSVTELNAATTLGNNDVMEVLQGGENKKVPVSVVKESVNSDVLTDLNKRGVFNVTVSVPLAAGSYYTLSTAIAAVPTASKSLGLDLKFSTAANTWVVYRYKGSDLTGWATTTNWEQVPDAAKLTSLETDLNEKIGTIIAEKEIILNPTKIGVDSVWGLTTSVFSGWGQAVGILPSNINAFSFKVRARITAITKIRFTIYENNPTGTVLADVTQDVNIAPYTEADVIIKLPSMFDNSANKQCFAMWRCNQLCDLWRADSGSFPYLPPTYAGVYYSTSGNLIGQGLSAANYVFPITYGSYDLRNELTDEQIDNISQRIQIPEPSNEAIGISLPDKIYATVGDTLQLFYRGMVKAPNPYIYDILVSCVKGKQYPRYFEYIPVSGDVGTTTFKVDVKNKDGVVLGTKTCSLITKAVVQSPSTTKKILCVGDSLTSSGVWCIEASRRLIGTGGTPAGLALSNISFLGRKTGGGIGWEGTGGWTWTSYATAGIPAYKFFLSSVTTAPGIGSTYTNNGITYTVSEVNITVGAGYISATGSGTPTSSGTLTKASGAGDATLTFSSYTADSGNPFWEADTNSLDFPQYVNTYMGGGCDVIYFLLSWNSQTPWRTDFASMITTAKILIDHIHANYPNCKMKIMGLQVPSLNGGMGANYGAAGTSYSDTYGNVVTVLNMNKAYQDWCNEAAYSSFLEFVNVSSQFDSENNMPETDKAVNARSTKTEKIGTNGVHPSTEGYYQIGDVVFRNFVANFCQ